VALTADADRLSAAFLAGLRRGPQRQAPFTILGTLSVSYDGKTCALAAPPTTRGLYSFHVTSTFSGTAAVVLLTLHPGHTWKEVLESVAHISEATENPSFIDIVVVQPAAGGLDPVAAVPSGTSAVACVQIVDDRAHAVNLGEPFTLPE
jgi:hypothetical protein